MMLITHAVVGAAIGHAVGGPWAALMLGFASHFLLDLLPHGDAYLIDHYRKGKNINLSAVYLIVDTLATAGFVWIVALSPYGRGGWPFAGIVGATLPDFMVWLAEMMPARALRAYFEFHEWVHGLIALRLRDFTLPAGIAVQVTILVIAFLGIL